MRAFSGEEKELIKEKLLENGKKIFARYGIKRTTIEELTKSAGIAKGSFYGFFRSKEHLFYEILSLEIRRCRDKNIKIIMSAATDSYSLVKTFIGLAVDDMETNEIMKIMLVRDERDWFYHQLKLAGVDNAHEELIRPLVKVIEEWSERGIIAQGEPEVLAKVIRSLFLLTTHGEEYGQHYRQVMDYLIEFITKGLLRAR